jgi:hypothetical protein
MSYKTFPSVRRIASTAGRFLGVASLAALVGCGASNKTTNPTKPVPLTLAAQGVGGATHRYAPSAAAATGDVSTLAAEIPVTYTAALLVVRDVRFVLPEMMDGDDDGQSDSLGMGEGQTDSLDMGDDDGDGDDGQIRFKGPFVIDLLSGQAERLGTQMVLPGDYKRVQGHLRSLRDGDEDAGAHPDLVGYTVWLQGTIEGEEGGDFSYLARIDNEFQIRGAFTVEEETPATAFVTFDLSKWLVDRDGHFLDPRETLNDKAIKSAIRHSIKVGMDHDHDGEMDDDEMNGEGGE